jgi:sodium pump decarboxylase gamma subunit
MDNLGFGLVTTVLGMGIVFGLLALLWALLSLVLRVERRGVARAAGAAPSPAAEPAGATSGAADADAGQSARTALRVTGLPGDLDPRLVAAITVAVLRHEAARRQQAAPAMRSYWPGSLLFASRWVASGRMRQGQTWRRRR